MARKHPGFFARMRRRIYVLVALGVLILLAILYLRCNGGGGGFLPGGNGSGTMNGPSNGSTNANAPISNVDPNSNTGAGSILHRFFVLRFEQDNHDPKQVRAAYANLILPSGVITPIEGRVEGSDESSLNRYYANLEAKLKSVRAMPAFASIGDIYLEDYTNPDGEQILSNSYRNKHKELVGAIFASPQWRSSAEINEMLKK